MNPVAAILANLHSRPRGSFVAAVLSAGLLAVAFPPSPFYLLALVALVPYYDALSRTTKGFRLGFLAGVAYNLGTVWWIALNSDLPPLAGMASMLAAVFWLSLLWGVCGWVTTRAVSRFGPAGLWAHPLAVIALDWLVTSSEMGFPWNLVGVTQAMNPVLAPVAALAGMHGLTLLVLVANLLVLAAVRRGSAKPLLVCLLLLLVSGGAGWLSTPRQAPIGQADLLLVQGNVDPLEKWRRPWGWSLGIHERLSRLALVDAPADLVIWPETAVPTRFSTNYGAQVRLARFCRDTKTPLLTGANDVTDTPDSERPRNGSFLVDSTGIRDRFYKIHLVPFGERVPGQKLVPALGRLNLGQAEFQPGTDRSPGRLAVDGDTMRFGRSICFEGNFPGHARRMVLQGASLLTNQTNDAWFGHSLELDQHLAVARLRAIETGRWLVRACNNGYSAAIDERGRVRAMLPKGERNTLRVAVELRSGYTVYTRTGDLLPKLALLLLVAAAVVSFRRPGK